MPPIRKEKGGKTARTAPYAGTASLPTNKKHGQHLLKNPGIVDKIMTACDLKPSDTVFEIGPGTGNLTMKLLAGAKRVLAYEIDPRMACEKEFAERLIAKVGEKQYGRLAVNTRLFVKVSCVCKVSKGSFNPPPEVDSMVVKFVPRDPPIEVNFREWDGLMRICFGRKNKTLQSSFKTSHTIKMLEDNYKTWCVLTGTTPQKGSVKDLVMEALNACDMADKRAIRIDLDEYFKLLLEFNKRGIHFSNLSAGAKIGDHAEGGKKDVAMPDESFFDDMGGDGDGAMED